MLEPEGPGHDEPFPTLDDLSEALDVAYPKFDMSAAEAKFQADRPCVERLCQELHSRLQPNALRICYEVPFLASTAGDLVWGDESYEVYLPIKQPIGAWSSPVPQLEFCTDELGLVAVRIRQKERPPKRPRKTNEQPQQRLQPLTLKPVHRVAHRRNKDNNWHHKDKKKKMVAAERDPLDHLKSSDGQFLTSSAALKATARLAKLALHQLVSEHNGKLVVHRVRLDKDCGTVRVSVEARPEFFVSTNPPAEAGDAKGGGCEEAAECQKTVTFAFPVEAELDSTTEQKLRASPEPSEPRFLELRLTPALRLPSDSDQQPQQQQAFATPPAAPVKSDASSWGVWTLRYPLDEAAVLACVARADGGVRLRVWRGIAELCQRDAGLALTCLADRRLPLHCLMELAESEIDSGGCDGGGSGELCWQRASYADCTRRLLGSLRDRLTEGRLPHYFNQEVNLLGRVSPHDCRAAAAKLDFFLRRPAALVRAALKAGAGATLIGGMSDDD